MKKTLAILFLICCAFTSSIYAAIFPEDIYGKALLFVFIFEIVMAGAALLLFFLYQRFIKHRSLKIVAVCLTGTLFIILNLFILPTQYGPMDFYADSSKILAGYENISLKNFKNSTQTKDVLMNTAVLEKYNMSPKLYHIRYLDISSQSSTPKRMHEFPIWIVGDKPIYENSTLTSTENGGVFTFVDHQYPDTLEFWIGADGLNSVEQFYSGGGTNQDNIRESGVVTQKDVRIIVSMSNPELEVDNAYGTLLHWILKMAK